MLSRIKETEVTVVVILIGSKIVPDEINIDLNAIKQEIWAKFFQ